MNIRTLIAVTGAALGLASAVSARTPAVPAAAPASGGCFAGLCACLSACKLNCCASPAGQLIGSMFRPLSIMTGGVIPTPCASNAANALAAAAGQPGPTGAAAAIAAEEANAKARRAAVRYLGTVDCHWFPEAEAMLIAALRADQNECVRWEAAHSFANGCCCTKKTVEALTICVQASDKDGNPSEDSLRVRAEAYVALQRCCSAAAVEPVRPELPGAEMSTQLPVSPMAVTMSEAQRTVEVTEQELRQARAHRHDRSLLGAWAQSREPAPPPTKRLFPSPQMNLPEPTLAKGPRPGTIGPVASGPLWTPQRYGEIPPIQAADGSIEFADRPDDTYRR